MDTELYHGELVVQLRTGCDSSEHMNVLLVLALTKS
jgi:hypothetical protein